MAEKYRSGMLYPHNVLDGFNNGAILDLRVRMANQFIASPLFQGLGEGLDETELAHLPKVVARFALDLAEEITALAAERGWLSPLPEDAELPQWIRDQARRTASFSVLQQLEGQKFAQGEQARVMPAAPTGIDPRKH